MLQAGWLAWNLREDFMEDMAFEGPAHLDKWRWRSYTLLVEGRARHRLTDENQVACELRNPLFQSRIRAKSQEGGAWAVFVLT